MTDIERRIADAIARVTASRAAAEVIAEIERTHVLIDRDTAMDVYTVLMAAHRPRVAMRLNEAMGFAAGETTP